MNESFAAVQYRVRYYTQGFEYSCSFCVVQSTTNKERSFFMEQKSNTKRLVVLAFLIALEIILTRFCSIQTPIVRIGFGFSAGCYDGDFIRFRSGPGCGYAIGDLLGMLIFRISSLLPGIYPDGIFDRNDIRVFPQGKRDHLEKRAACQPARDPGMQSVSGYVMALHFDG